MHAEPRGPRSASLSTPPAVALDDPRLARLRADVTARLARACADLSPAAFDELVADICAMQLRWDPHALVRWQR